MTLKRIFVTGASGCIGHYVVEALIQETNHELFLLVRNPEKLKFDYRARPGITVLQGDMREIDRFSELLKTIDCAILIATSWGGVQDVYDINVTQTLRLMDLLDPDVCQQVVYFSTASILNRENQPLKEAERRLTIIFDRSPRVFSSLPSSRLRPALLRSFLRCSLAAMPKSRNRTFLLVLFRCQLDLAAAVLKAEGSFHFIHGKDIAQIVCHLVEHPPAEGERRQLVLGNQMVTVNQAIEETCLYLNKRLYFRVPLTPGLANLFIALFRIKMADWDRFSMHYRHFTHRHVVSPETFGLPTYCATFMDVLKLSGVGRR
jgi:nucleoside-diphosphate-sugar epimerase